MYLTEFRDCREVTKGLETLSSMEKVSTRTEGMFVMPETRLNILSSYVYLPGGYTPAVGQDGPIAIRAYTGGGGTEGTKECSQQLEELQQRFDAQAASIQELRSHKLPG